MTETDTRLYSRVSAGQIFKNCGDVCIVGRIASYNAKNQRITLITN